VAGVRTTLEGKRGNAKIVLTLQDAQLVTDGVVETFASNKEAKAKLDAVLRQRLKEGYSMSSTEIVDDEPAPASEPAPSEPSASGDGPAMPPEVKVDEAGRWMVTFDEEASATKASCAELTSRIAAEKPRSVQLICDLTSPGANWSEALRGCHLPSVKDFIFDTYFQTQTRQGPNSIGDLGTTFEAFDSLQRMFATGALSLAGPSMHEHLRELSLLGDPLSEEFLGALARSRFPALEQLVISLASDAGPGDDAAALAAIRGLSAHTDRLRIVHVESLADVAAFLDALVESGVTRRLREVRLQGSADEEAILAVIERHASALSNLEVLALPLGDELSSDADEAIRARLPCACDTSEFGDAVLPASYAEWKA